MGIVRASTVAYIAHEVIVEYGLLLEDALAGQSEIRNKALAQAFQYMRLIEYWGRDSCAFNAK